MYNLAMKLVIQIPCFNEEANIQSVLEEIPKKIKGIKEIKVIVLDDGSTDKTSEIAKKYNGYVNRQSEEGIFATEIMLPL